MGTRTGTNFECLNGFKKKINRGFEMFSHEKLHVYCLSIEFVAWSYEIAKTFKGIDRTTKDQLIRASQSIPLNIAEGNGRKPTADRARFFQIAYGSH